MDLTIPRHSFFQRAITPALTITGIMVVSMVFYRISRLIENGMVHALVAHVSAILMFLSIWLGGLFVNTVSFFRGASFSERMGFCLITPVIWSITVMIRLYGIYPLGEFLFFILHPLVLGCPVAGLLCMGVSELWCKKIHNLRYKKAPQKLFEWHNTLLLIVSLCLTALFLWGGGHFYVYNIYMKLHGLLFN